MPKSVAPAQEGIAPRDGGAAAQRRRRNTAARTAVAHAEPVLHPVLPKRASAPLLGSRVFAISSAPRARHSRLFRNPAMPSFDIVSEVSTVEVRNAVDQTNREVSTRFDFKGSDARVELADTTLALYADDEFKLRQVADILTAKLTKRGVDVRALDYGAVEPIGGRKAKQQAKLRIGVDAELAKKIVRIIKDSKLKLQASIQGDAVRVSGAKRDDLQRAIALVKQQVTDVPLQYGNFRD
jgi:uncharacterized protein YajQ (UPF0234 family)